MIWNMVELITFGPANTNKLTCLSVVYFFYDVTLSLKLLNGPRGFELDKIIYLDFQFYQTIINLFNTKTY